MLFQFPGEFTGMRMNKWDGRSGRSQKRTALNVSFTSISVAKPGKIYISIE